MISSSPLPGEARISWIEPNAGCPRRKMSSMPSFNGLLGSLGRRAENPARNDGRRSTSRTRNASTPRILMQLAPENQDLQKSLL